MNNDISQNTKEAIELLLKLTKDEAALNSNLKAKTTDILRTKLHKTIEFLERRQPGIDILNEMIDSAHALQKSMDKHFNRGNRI